MVCFACRISLVWFSGIFIDSVPTFLWINHNFLKKWIISWLMAHVEFTVDGCLPTDKKSPSLMFKETIAHIVDDLDEEPGKSYSLASIYNKYNISRRRFYDVVNVLSAIGCCRRTRLNDIIWVGRWNISDELKLIVNNSLVENEKINLEDLFETENCVCLSNLTISFLVLFATIDSDSVDLREVAAFLSRRTSRYKTTLCKLYQISLILGALKIIQRSSEVCKVSILSPYKEMLQIKYKIDSRSPYTIGYLLNGACQNISKLISRREEEFHKLGVIIDDDFEE